jgi:hypothetical protein
VTVVLSPTPDEEPRCLCGARLIEKERDRKRKTKVCRKCRARARWQRSEQAQRRIAAQRMRRY